MYSLPRWNQPFFFKGKVIQSEIFRRRRLLLTAYPSSCDTAACASNSREATSNENQIISPPVLRTTNFHVVDLKRVYFRNIKAISGVPSFQCSNTSSAFMILSEHISGKTTSSASVYNFTPFVLSQAHFMIPGFHIFSLCKSHQRRTSIYTRGCCSSEQTTAENKFNI